MKTLFCTLPEKKQLQILRSFVLVAVILFSYYVFKYISISLWRDEAFTALVVERSFVDIIRTIVNENNPPLYYVIVAAFTRIFGNSEIALRLPSLIFMLATIPVLRASVSNKFLKEIATIIFLLLPNVFVLATEARYYALLIFLFSCAFYINTLFAQKVSRKLWIAFIVVNIALLYTHSLGIILYATNILTMIYIKYGGISLRQIIQYFKENCPVIIPGVIFIPWMVVLARQVLAHQEFVFWLQFTPLGSLEEIFDLFGYRWVSIFLNFFLLWAVIASFVEAWRQKERKYLLPFVSVVMIYLISFYMPLFYSRYLSYLLPLLAIILAIGLWRVLSRAQEIYVFLALLLISLSSWGLFHYYYWPSSHADYQSATAYIESFENGSLAHLNDNEYSLYPCEYYLRDCRVLLPLEQINRNIGWSIFTDDFLISTEDIGSYERIAIIAYSKDVILPEGFHLIDSAEFHGGLNVFILDNVNKGPVLASF